MNMTYTLTREDENGNEVEFDLEVDFTYDEGYRSTGGVQEEPESLEINSITGPDGDANFPLTADEEDAIFDACWEYI